RKRGGGVLDVRVRILQVLSAGRTRLLVGDPDAAAHGTRRRLAPERGCRGHSGNSVRRESSRRAFYPPALPRSLRKLAQDGKFTPATTTSPPPRDASNRPRAPEHAADRRPIVASRSLRADSCEPIHWGSTALADGRPQRG